MSVKEQLLDYLEQCRGESISGQVLADRLGVSRAAVWKAAKRLEEEGHKITAGTNRGYRLEMESDQLTAQGVRCLLPPEWRDCTIIKEPCVDSTNTLAKKLAADGAADGTVVLAETQSSGRGRMGHPFFSPPGTGLYLSVVLRPQLPAAALRIVTAAAAVAVCEAVEVLAGCRTQVKWVNDILLDGKKICGILTEAVSDFESGMTECVIVGIGVNVSTPARSFPEELRGTAASLLPARVARNRLAAEIIQRLRAYAAALPARPFMEAYRARSAALGRQVLYLQGQAWREGRAVGIDGDGALLLDTPDGPVTLHAGRIKLR